MDSKCTFQNIDQCVGTITELTVTAIEFKRLLYQADNGTGAFSNLTLKQRWQFKTNIRQKIEECEKIIEDATNIAIAM